MPDRRAFIDTRSVRSFQHVAYRLHAAAKHGEPLIVGDKPWERYGVTLYGSVHKETDAWRMWYQSWPGVPPKGSSSWVAYAESRDGLQWEKVELGLTPFDGDARNNLTNLRRHQPSILLDPAAPPAERYKAIGFATEQHVAPEDAAAFARPGFYTAHSADGRKWTEYPDPAHLAVPDYGDVGAFVYDRGRGLYIGTPKRSHRVGLNMRRSVHLCTSPDFVNWTEPHLVLAPDELDDRIARERGFSSVDFYGMTVMPQPDFWLGLLWVFYIREPLAKVMLRRSHNQFHRGFGVYGKVEVQLIFSYDGRYWLRAPGRQPFIPWGERGAFDGGSVYTANAPVEHGDDLYFYYSGTLTEHGDGKHAELHTAADGSTRQAGIGLATIKRDRYASFSADGDGLLEVDHGPLTGGQLSVNAYCPHGFIKAELAGLDGQTLPGFEAEACLPFTGDATAGSLRWREADLAQLADGREVLIRFHMYNADLFAYEIGV